MKPVVIVLVGAAVALAAACATEKPGAGAPAPADKGAAELAKVLSGRVAGPPQECVNLPDIENHKVYGTNVIVFESSVGGVLFVNRPPAMCAGLTFGRAIKIRGTLTRLCRGDTVTTVEPQTGVEYGSCTLGEFVPYSRP